MATKEQTSMLAAGLLGFCAGAFGALLLPGKRETTPKVPEERPEGRGACGYGHWFTAADEDLGVVHYFVDEPFVKFLVNVLGARVANSYTGVGPAVMEVTAEFPNFGTCQFRQIHGPRMHPAQEGSLYKFLGGPSPVEFFSTLTRAGLVKHGGELGDPALGRPAGR